MLNVVDFDLADYREIWAKQQDFVRLRAAGEIPDTLLIGEHFPVLTLGRGTQPENLLNPTLPVVSVERGGDVTYHGPGQLVAYPIVFLKPGQRDLHRWLRFLEEGVLTTLADYQITGFRLPGKTGVWVYPGDDPAQKPLKIAAIGVAVKHWVTYHGLSLNVNPDLAHYHQINPCGFSSDSVTSMAQILQNPPDMARVKSSLAGHLQTQWGLFTPILD